MLDFKCHSMEFIKIKNVKYLPSRANSESLKCFMLTENTCVWFTAYKHSFCTF